MSGFVLGLPSPLAFEPSLTAARLRSALFATWRRLIRLDAAAAAQPHGRTAKVFATDEERHGAYDFVECSGVNAGEHVLAFGQALHPHLQTRQPSFR